MGDSLTVELSALDRAVLVRIQVPQPSNPLKPTASFAALIVEHKLDARLRQPSDDAVSV